MATGGGKQPPFRTARAQRAVPPPPPPTLTLTVHCHEHGGGAAVTHCLRIRPRRRRCRSWLGIVRIVLHRPLGSVDVLLMNPSLPFTTARVTHIRTELCCFGLPLATLPVTESRGGGGGSGAWTVVVVLPLWPLLGHKGYWLPHGRSAVPVCPCRCLPPPGATTADGAEDGVRAGVPGCAKAAPPCGP